jgi:predicted MPP superfamily phosphohydrolase
MSNDKQKLLFYTDTHMDRVMLWSLLNFFRHVRKENPHGIFLTGDISNGKMLCYHLKLMAQYIKCPIYFILGNHDIHRTSFSTQYENIIKLCEEFPNLIWISNIDHIKLNEEVYIIGDDGWYDAKLGDPKWLKFTTDWLLIEEFRKMSSMEERIEAFRERAAKSCKIIAKKLEKVLKNTDAKTIYILTHCPPWKEATRDEGTILEKFYLPYNINLGLGKVIEKIMEDHKKRNVIVCCGHTHTPEFIRVARNISCQVGAAGIKTINSQKIYV